MNVFKTLITELGEAAGIEGIEPDERGVVRLLVEDSIDLIIQCHPDQAYLTLYTVTSVISLETLDGDLLADLLAANLFGEGTKGATFALERTTGQVILQQKEPLDGLNASSFQALFQNFVETAVYSQKRFFDKQLEDESESTETAPEALPSTSSPKACAQSFDCEEEKSAHYHL